MINKAIPEFNTGALNNKQCFIVYKNELKGVCNA